MFAYAPKMETTDFEFIEKPKRPLVPFILKVYIMAAFKDNDKAEITTLAEFVSTKSKEAGFRSAFASVRRQNNHFDVDSDGGLV